MKIHTNKKSTIAKFQSEIVFNVGNFGFNICKKKADSMFLSLDTRRCTTLVDFIDEVRICNFCAINSRNNKWVHNPRPSRMLAFVNTLVPTQLALLVLTFL